MAKKKKEFIPASEMYDRHARSYDEVLKQDLFWEAHRHVFDHVKTFRSDLTDLRLLDLGIGTGLTTEPFAKAGAVCHGIDASEKMLEVCSKKGIAGVTQRDLQAVPYPFPAESFDIVISEGVLYLIKRLQPILQEAHRLLKQDGVLQISLETLETVRKDHILRRGNDFFHKETYDAGLAVHLHSDKQIRADLDAAGFHLLDTKTFTAGFQKGIMRLLAQAPRLPAATVMRITQNLRVEHASYICAKKEIPA